MILVHGGNMFSVNKVVNVTEDTCEIVLLGDTSFGENYQQLYAKKNPNNNILQSKGYDYCLNNFRNFLTTANLVIANLETPLTSLTQSPYAGKKSYIHFSDVDKAPESLLKHNISVVTLANNHSFDYGAEGLL